MKLPKSQKRVYDLYKKLGVKSEVARKLNLSRSTVRRYLKIIEEKGFDLTPEVFSEHTPVGFKATKTTQHIKYDQDGKAVIQQEWLRSSPSYDNVSRLQSLIRDRTPLSGFKCQRPKLVESDLMLEWCLADLHHGMRAAEEQSGKDHNLEISRESVITAANDIFFRADKVAVTKLMVLGDFYHSDFFSNKTEKSGHSLWTSDTYMNIARCGMETVITATEIALTKSTIVEIEILPGNHSQHSEAWLQLLLETHFKKNKRVRVSCAQTSARFYAWGRNFFGYHHGHTTTSTRLAMETLIMANKEEGAIDKFYARTAHLHNGNKMFLAVEDAGSVTIERIPTLAPRDKFTADGCYNSVRGTVATVFHKTKGQRYRLDISGESNS